MKPNAPEKIYLEKVYPDNGVLPNGLNYNQSINDIEYVRTDSFIENVINFLNYKLDDVVSTRVPGTIIPHHIAKQELIEDFREYMEGE
jgi:hypothetical protein